MFDHRGGAGTIEELPQGSKVRFLSASRTQSGVRRKEKAQGIASTGVVGDNTAMSVVGGSIEMFRSSTNSPQVIPIVTGADSKKVKELKDQNSKIKKMINYDSDDDGRRAPRGSLGIALPEMSIRRERAQSFAGIFLTLNCC
jgi:hypothetical protein